MGIWAFKTILKIFCIFLSVYLVTKDLEEPIIESTKSSWLESREGKNPKKSLEMRSLQKHPQPQIKIILVVKVKQSKVNSK